MDIETKLDHKTIHLVKTIDIDTGEVRTWKEAKPLQEWSKAATLIVAHNGIGFDFSVLKKHWNMTIPKNLTFDTLILSRLLEPSREQGHSLEAWGNTLGTKKTDYKKIWEWMMDRREAYKGECFDAPIMPLLDYYCEQDVVVLRALYLHLTAEKERLGFSDESVELEHDVAYIIKEQEDNGFKLDIPYALGLLSEVKTKLADIEEWFQQRWPPVVYERVSEKTGKKLKDGVQTFNPGSRKQIGEKLRELGWKPTEFTETGQPIVDEGTLKGLPWEEARKFEEYLLLQKRIAQIESWVEAVGPDGRVHGKVITNGAVTGRMTHSSPNMAQVPNAGSLYGPECRECWTVEDGNVLVGADASGLELRMLAHYMRDDKYTEAIVKGSSKDGTDIHTVNQKAAGLATRDQAKTFIYAFLYGAGPAKIGSIVGGTAKEGKKLTDKFLQQTPALARLKKKLEPFITKGYVPGLDGRKIWIRSEHAALNSLLQGAGAIVMKKALVLFFDRIRETTYHVKLVATVHDEVQLETRPAAADDVGRIARQAIIDAGIHFELRCPLDGEYKVGASWRATH